MFVCAIRVARRGSWCEHGHVLPTLIELAMLLYQRTISFFTILHYLTTVFVHRFELGMSKAIMSEGYEIAANSKTQSHLVFSNTSSQKWPKKCKDPWRPANFQSKNFRDDFLFWKSSRIPYNVYKSYLKTDHPDMAELKSVCDQTQ
jgi:hypothetical protein